MLIPPRSECHPFTREEYLMFLFGYLELLVAHAAAQERRWSPRACPVPLAGWRARGIVDAIPLWLLYQGHVEHLLPAGPRPDGTPDYQPVASVVLLDTSALVLTQAGAAFFNDFLGQILSAPDPRGRQAALRGLLLGPLLPRYEKDSRLLAWGVHVLKCFRQQAANQILLLVTAEEQGWASWFDDPLAPRPGRSAKRRLHDTLADLNRRQTPYLVRFKGDGTGTRFGWELRAPAAAELQQRSNSRSLDSGAVRSSLDAEC